MLTLISTNLTVKRKSANALIKALRAEGSEFAGFEIYKENGKLAVSVEPYGCPDSSAWEVCIGQQRVRIIPRSEVIGTARLRVDAQRLRKTLSGAEAMIIRPV